MFDSLRKFIAYWYFRYTLVTELYMVEKWEESMIYVVAFAVFSLLTLFNSRIVLGYVSSYTNPDNTILMSNEYNT
ncbi:PREDICTED: uncharacterized protein LOC108569364 [Nicrophorus vespilloides]|uniref:Uncharacterized protein LOC108569364 n=1 Tax=Nicrophorus vespilloides TaxID=110193 RepID=A0ABM1NHS2_NICVS|nr:PREDICTED: uncharacterized protein LOC108569364 [Nicrophorus vespilloides]